MAVGFLLTLFTSGMDWKLGLSVSIVSGAVAEIIVLCFRISYNTECELKPKLAEACATAKFHDCLHSLVFFPGQSWYWSNHTHVEGRREGQPHGADALVRMATTWAGKMNNTSASADVWRVLFDQYINEEIIDVTEAKIATNTQLYADLLMSFMRYFLHQYGSNAVVRVLTTLRIPHWDGKEELATQPGMVTAIQDYWKELKSLIDAAKPRRKNGLCPDLRRYVVVLKAEEAAKKQKLSWRGQLESDIRSTYATLTNKYIRELHFRESQACYLVWNDLFETDPHLPDELRDFLAFGHKQNGAATHWLWMVGSTVMPGHDAMVVKFWDAQTYSKLEVEKQSIDKVLNLIDSCCVTEGATCVGVLQGLKTSASGSSA